MSEQSVTLEVAVLAQEKGFDVKVRRYFCNGQLSGDMEQLANWNNVAKTHVSAPNPYVLQTWLREVHQIDMYVLPIRFTGHLEIGYYTYATKGIQPLGKEHYKFDTWEAALEAGLLKALQQVNEQSE